MSLKLLILPVLVAAFTSAFGGAEAQARCCRSHCHHRNHGCCQSSNCGCQQAGTCGYQQTASCGCQQSANYGYQQVANYGYQQTANYGYQQASPIATNACCNPRPTCCAVQPACAVSATPETYSTPQPPVQQTPAPAAGV